MNPRVSRAFFQGRLRMALQPVLPVLAFAALSWRLGKTPVVVCVVAAIVLLTACAAFFLGRGFRRGAIVGLRAGAVSFFAPVLAGHNHCQLGGQCVAYCLLACLAAGFLAGGYAGWTIARFPRDRSEAFVVGALSCVSLSFLGCSMAGTASLYNLAGGFVLGSFPLGLAAWRWSLRAKNS